MKLRLAIALLSGAYSVGACSVPEDKGVREVQDIVLGGSDQAVHWFRDAEHNQRVADAVTALLAKGLTLPAAEKVALLNNKRLQATFEELGIAQADLFQAGLIANPRIGVAVKLPTTGDLSPNVVGDFGLDLVGVFTIAARERVAEAELDRVVLIVARAILDAVYDVRRAYYTFQAAQQEHEINHTVASTAQVSFDTATALHAAGSVGDLQLAEEQAMLEEARLALLDSEGAVVEAREELNRLLGLWGQPAQSWWIEGSLAAIPRNEANLRKVVTLAVARRLDLKALRKKSSRIAAELRMAGDFAWLHHFELGAAFEREREGTVTVGPAVGLSLPIFDQGQGQVARLRAELMASYHDATALAVDIRAEVRVLCDKLLRHRRKSIHYRDVIIPLREKIVGLTLKSSDSALVGTFDLLRKKRLEAEAYRDYLREMRDYWITRSELARAAGGRLPIDRAKLR
jgi:cobalt-zinc-cadmium efflux system outer membrane protein